MTGWSDDWVGGKVQGGWVAGQIIGWVDGWMGGGDDNGGWVDGCVAGHMTG